MSAPARRNSYSDEWGLRYEDWKTADEPMTEAQRSYLETLTREAGMPFEDEPLTKAEASKRIEELRQQSPRLNTEEFEDAE